MIRAGDIQQLEVHPEFVLQESTRYHWTGEAIPRRVFKADFKYWDVRRERWIVEDVKPKRITDKGNVVPYVMDGFYFRWDRVRLLYPVFQFEIVLY